jgi:hypothetical protein
MHQGKEGNLAEPGSSWVDAGRRAGEDHQEMRDDLPPQATVRAWGEGHKGKGGLRGYSFFFGAVKVIVCWKSGGMEEKWQLTRQV